MRGDAALDEAVRLGGRPEEPREELPARLARVVDLFPTRRAAAAAAGVSVDQIARYLAGVNAPPFAVVSRLAQAQGISLDWIATGSGSARAAPPVGAAGLQVLGMMPAEPGGWYRENPLAIRLPPLPGVSPSETVALLAPDDALREAGIAAGHVCFCVASSPLVQGDLVYLRRADGMATLAQVLEADEDRIRFARSGAAIEMPLATLELVAPVLQVRRKW
ncbi:MAG TPA: helix-turn-helix transcriptional regulator [Azospirillaceae bacterium]|nr:helix-turn-helix transcriptional regulator [Azospirillaceae bacterium]